jgi:hypothetical protein
MKPILTCRGVPLGWGADWPVYEKRGGQKPIWIAFMVGKMAAKSYK